MRILITLLLLAILSACAPTASPSPTPEQSPTIEPTTSPSKTAALPSPTESVIPTPTYIHASRLSSPIVWVPETGAIPIVSYSPGGAWRAEMLFSEERLLLQVIRADEQLAWLVLDDNGPLSLDTPFPSEFRWSWDGRYLFYYGDTSWDFMHPGEENPCVVSGINVNPRRLDLNSGEITPLTHNLSDEPETFSISPSGDAFAYFDPDRTVNRLFLQDLATGEEKSFRFDVPANLPWTVGDIVWAPDERALAFAVVADPCHTTGDSATSLVVVELETGYARTVIANDPDMDWQFEWPNAQTLCLHGQGTSWRVDVNTGEAPAEERTPLLTAEEGRGLGELTFIAESDGYPAVYTLRTDGTGRTQQSEDLSGLFEDLIPFQITFGGWSPDGTWLAFSGTVQNGQNDQDIFIARLDGTERLNLTDSPETDLQPNWSPDGQALVFTSRPLGLYQRVNLYTLSVSQSYTKDGVPSERLGDTLTDDSVPVWSPDGRKIAFVSSRLDESGQDLYIVDADGSGVRQITRKISVGSNGLAWSPDGKRLAFISADTGNPELYVVNRDGTGLRQITQSDYQIASSPAWSPDGNYIAYLSTQNEVTGIYIARSDGSGLWQVEDLPVWAHSLVWETFPIATEP